jgi:hypothetical protein
MLAIIRKNLDERLRSSLACLNGIPDDQDSQTATTDEFHRTLKGLYCVSIYAAIEYTVTSCCSSLLDEIESCKHKSSDFKNLLLCTLFDSKFKGLQDPKNKSKWKSRKSLIDSIFSENPILNIDNTIMPGDSSNIRVSNLEEIWEFFHLETPISPIDVNIHLLNEITDRRNELAHGRSPASEIGRRYTKKDLVKRHEAMSKLCSHILISFEKHIEEKEYLKP